MEKPYDEYKLGYHTNGRKDIFNEKKEYVLKDKKEKLDFLRKATGYTLTISQRTIPVAGFVHEADITEFWNEYKRLNTCGEHPLKITFNTLMLRLIAECLKTTPILNAHMSYNPFNATGKLFYKGQIDISMPTIFPNGRMLPILVRDAGNKNLDEMAAAVAELERKLANTIIDESLFDVASRRLLSFIKKGKILQSIAQGVSCLVGPQKVDFMPIPMRAAYRRETDPNEIITHKEIGEGTICVSDVGSIYSGRGFATTSPILTPTTSCMAFSRVRDEQYIYKDENGEVQIGVKKILPFSLLFDHKIGGFPDVVPFLDRMDEIFANPEVIRNW